MKITQAFTFEAAHSLPNVPKNHKCYRIHGHSYRVELVMEGDVDPKTGFVDDFFNIEKYFSPLLEILDHQYLNEIPDLYNPTAENIAIWIWKRLCNDIPILSAVRVYETPMSWVEYTGV
ncbi:MAG: 6-carboxytetrahydropterin synthase QueD [Candidatus Liberibacter europaeus]|uniref:6-carboxy-5,6,7,8-tetrahydropterin synthase n=1 Tax=Candidatus Liberibacter europaeus TaxID=744859 RepID=A0A2T4VWB4_9HYPH|nr:6-carboxytetrahydropterin synthase QueD [Candidatus Liberibacter europaeus]PTL86065.1 MAG: 6-carboxytetrahydropterin synthase QueD [Candidatus Liberibacter europaeus]